MRINKDSWYIVQRVIRRYPENKKLLPESEGVFRDRLIREIEAVESAYNTLPPEHQVVIERRFWKHKDRNTQYECMQDAGYSICQMKRITEKMIRVTGERLGEVAKKQLKSD
jgi:hypothetical protein